FRPLAQQQIGDLDQAARAVAHRRVRAHGTAMIEVNQELQPLRDDLVGLLALDIGHKAHAAGVVLVRGVVKPLLFGRRDAGICHLLFTPSYRQYYLRGRAWLERMLPLAMGLKMTRSATLL